MKTIINMKRYDTDNAIHVADYCNGYYRNDFKFLSLDLYITKIGAWFLHGQGGGLTEYAERHGSHRCAGERIDALSVEEAQQWLMKYGKTSELEKYFPSDIEEA